MTSPSTKPAREWWLKFEPGLWLQDPALRCCGLAARGLWVDMIARMWLAEQRGVLPGDLVVLSRLVGASVEEVRPLLLELERAGVFTRGLMLDPEQLEGDAIVCRRMWREEQRRRGLSAVRSAAGRLGGRPKKVVEGDAEKQSESKAKAKPKQNESKNGVYNHVAHNGLASVAESKKNPLRVRVREEERSEDPHTEPSGIAHAGNLVLGVLGRLAGQFTAPEPLGEQACRVAQDSGPWAAWWLGVGEVLDQSKAGRAMLRDLCHEAESLSQKGELHSPGKWMAQRVLAWCRANRIEAPAMPGVKGKA